MRRRTAKVNDPEYLRRFRKLADDQRLRDHERPGEAERLCALVRYAEIAAPEDRVSLNKPTAAQAVEDCGPDERRLRDAENLPWPTCHFLQNWH